MSHDPVIAILKRSQNGNHIEIPENVFPSNAHVNCVLITGTGAASIALLKRTIDEAGSNTLVVIDDLTMISDAQIAYKMPPEPETVFKIETLPKIPELKQGYPTQRIVEQHQPHIPNHIKKQWRRK